MPCALREGKAPEVLSDFFDPSKESTIFWAGN
jgi:hypothetical protein